MDEDNPDYLVHEIFTQNFFKDHPLGKPILGTKETVRRFDQDAILGYYGAKFAPGNLIISAAGNLKHEEFVDLLRKRFESVCRRLERLARHAAEDRTPASSCATRSRWSRCRFAWAYRRTASATSGGMCRTS